LVEVERAARYPRDRVLDFSDPERVTDFLAPFQGANSALLFSGGLRFAATPGYSLATLRFAKRRELSSTFLFSKNVELNVGDPRAMVAVTARPRLG